MQVNNAMSKVLIVLAVLMTFGFADVVAGPPQNNTSFVRVYCFIGNQKTTRVYPLNSVFRQSLKEQFYERT